MRPKTFRIRALLTLFTAAIAITFGAHAQSSGSANIAATDVYISGSSLALEDVNATTGVNIPVQIQTSFGGLKNDQAPKVPELSAVGDLTGPGLSSPITLTTDPGRSFTIPGLPAEGTYLLQNVRLMRGSTFVQSAVPSSAAITVADILKTKVSVRQLTAAELRARGITIDDRNFDVYEYTLSFFVGTQEVLVPFPVMVDKRTHEIIPINKEQKYTIPGFKNVQSPPRWGPPTVSPMELGEDDQLPGPPPEDNGEAAPPPPPRIPAAIVIPNTLGVLHQFFAVALTVTNNAPDGSSITLDSITATLKNPPELRVADVKPAVSFGRPVPLVDPNTGTTILIAQAKAEADWTLEALKTGTHTFSIEVNASYRASSTADPIPLRGSVSQQIVVHDPRFNITFSHPDTVRQGLTYSTFTFVTNTTSSIQTIRLRTGDELPACSATGDASICRLDNDIESVPLCSGNTSVDLCRPADDLKSQELTLKPGATRTVVYKLRSNLTGNVFATAGSVDSDVIHAAVQLHMGVSTSGIPLSPATLVMPYYAQYLDQQFVTDELQLLGLGYSLATAPVNQTTASFPRVITTDVFHRAVDIARAGQRIFIGEDKRDSFANLTLDLLGNGNGNKLEEWDQLRRREYSGRVAGASLARQIEAASLKTAGDFDGFLARFGQTTAWRAPYFVAVTHGAVVTGNARPYALSLRGVTTNAKMDLPNELATEDSLGTRDVAFGDLSKLTSGDNLQTGEMAAAGLWSENYEITVTPAAGSSFVLDVLYPSTAAARIRHALVTVSNASGKALKGVLDPNSGIVTLTEDGGSASYSGNATEISPAPLAIIAAHQDMHLDDHGHKVAVLFNRPVDDATDYKPVFAGKVVFNQGTISYTGPRGVDAAALQDDARTIYLTFDHALSKNATYSLQVQPIRDPLSGTTTTFADVVPILENDRPAGIIYGRVLRGDNTPVPGAQVVLTSGGTIQYDTSSAAKADFLFEYVLRDLTAGVTGAYNLRAVDSDNKAVAVDGAIRLTGVVETVNLVYLGRGSAEGRVTYDNGDVVPNARVVIGSTLFEQFRSTATAADGTYKVTDLPVGPLTFSATDTLGNTTFGASEIRSAGEVVHQDLSIYRTPFPGTATVRGVVIRSDTSEPVPNAHVGVYTQGYGLTDAYTDANGHFEFDKVTTGIVTVLASEWTVSRKAVGIDFDLAPDQVKDLTLTLEVNPGQPLANLEGDVEEEDPLNPGTYKKVPGALVQIKDAQVVTCDANGHFSYSALPLTFSGKDIKAYNPASKRVGLTSVPTLDPATTAYVRIPIRVSDAFGTGSVQVRVLNAAGQPVSNMRVFEPGYPITPLRPIGDGKYQLDNVRVGSGVNVWAVTTGDPADPSSSRYTYGDQYTSGNASVAFNGQTSLTVLRMPGQGKVRVRLLTDIVSIGDVNMQYGVWDDAEQAVKTNTRTTSTKDPATGQAGYAIFDKVPVGGSNVYAALAGFGYDSKGLNLGYDGQIIDIDLTAKKLASVAGVVYNIDGITPMPGVPVRMTDGAQNQGPLPTALDGGFKFGNVAPARGFTVTAESTVGGIYRVGIAGGVTPADGGPVNNVSVTMKQQGSVEGFVVYSGYKVFDPNDPSKNVVDDTPNDLSDNARVPLAQFVLREVSYPYRSFGKDNAPLTADINGHFQINNVFAGPVRLDAWSQQNQDLRGSGNATVVQEGSTVSIYAAIGTQGFGPIAVTVVDPNNHNAPVENAEVTLAIPQYLAPPIIYDFGTTDANGTVRFEQVPARGGYEIDAFSKLVGKSGLVGGVTVVPFTGASVLVELQFSGSVNGTLTDPEANNAGVPGIPVILQTNGYQQQTSTTATGTYFLGGIHEGTFLLDAMQETTRRRAHAQGAVSAADPNPTVNMELEHTSPLYVKVFYPNDDGSASNVEVPTSDIHVKQRCRPVIGGEICEYARDLQGSGLVFTSLFASDGYSVSAHEVGGDQRSTGGSGSFPVGATAANPFKLTLPAYGTVQVTVRQPDSGGVMRPAVGARANVRGVIVTTDTNGLAIAHGIPLGDLSVGAVSFDGLFSAYSPTVHLGSQTVPLEVSLDLGAYAGVSGYVNAELGGPSFNTRVVASFPGRAAMTFTDATGFYKFQGISVANGQTTPVSLVYYGPDDKTVGASQSTTLGVADASQIRPLATVTLDATPPSVVSISPEDNSINVSPDSNIVVVFSEPIAENSINRSNFQLFPTDGSPAVNTTLVRFVDPINHTCTITAVVPPSTDPAQRFPLKSNMLYRVLLTGGLTDEQGHPLAQRGFSFITADYIAPKVVSLDPQTSVPLSASTTFNVRFNKPLASQLFNATHNLVAPLEMHLYKLSGQNGTVVTDLAGSAYGDQTNTTLSFAPSAQLEEKTYYRLAILGVRDTVGNVADPITYDYVSYDKTPPYITFDAPVPPGTPVISGVRYTLKTVIRDGSATADPATDTGRVDFFRVDGSTKTLLASLTKAPFEYSFVAPVVTQTGTTLTFHVEASDTSFNNATPQEITFDVAPNLPPQNVKLTLTTPDPIYPNKKVSATPSLTDEGVLVTLQAQLTGTKTDGTTYTSAGVTGQATRAKTTDPWTFTPASFDFVLPSNLQDGSTASITMTAADGVNTPVNATPATFTVAADTTSPTVTSLTVSPASPYHLNDKYTITAIVKDAETGVSDVTFTYDGKTTVVTGGTLLADGSYRFVTPQITVPAKNDDTKIAIVATAKDYRGNKGTAGAEVTYIGLHDATVPRGAWVSPIANAAWPSDQSAFTTTLRVYAKDDQAITSVTFTVPGIANPVTATAAGNDLYTAQVTLATPAAGTGFTVSAAINDADPSHTQTIDVPITLVKVDTVLGPNFTQAITSPTDPLLNKSVLLQGPNVHLVMHVPFTFRNLIAVDGASIETLPSTTTTERKLDLTVSDTFYADSTSIVDVAGKGYVGGWGVNQDSSGTKNEDSRGRTIGNTVTGGSLSPAAASHAGLGGVNGGVTNRVYGSITDPRTLGSGGPGAPTCCAAGGPGGGAASISGGSGSSDLAHIIVAGTIRADGITGPWSAGAGGSVRLGGKVVTLGRNARVTANGSDETALNNGSRGSGGGRIAILATDELDTDDTQPQIQARGGRNPGAEANTYLDAGAGTIYLRRPGQTFGELVISAFDDRAPATTHQTRPTILGYTGSGNSTSLTANTLTDSSRTFVSDAAGEELLLGGDTSKSYTITAVSSDGHTLTTDAADGSLLNAPNVSNGGVAYAGLLQFDAIRVSDRALARFDDSFATGGAVDDVTKATVTAPALALLRTDFPVIASFTTTPAAGSNLIRASSFTANYTATSLAGIGAGSLAFSPVAAPNVDAFSGYPTPATKTNKSIGVPFDAALGNATLALTVTDRSDRSTTSAATSFAIIDNTPPAIDRFDVTPSSLALYAGHSISVDSAASDDLGITSLTLATSLGTLTSGNPVVNGTSTSRTFTVAVPPATKGGTTINLTLSASDGFSGRAATTQSKTVTITTDPNPPAINVTGPAAGTTYQVSSNVTIPVRAVITDAEVAVDPAQVYVSLGGANPVAMVVDPSTPNGFKADLPVPAVDGTQPVQKSIVVTAKDYEGNPASSTAFNVNIQPVFDPNGPIVSWLCPATGSGALFNSGYTVIARVSANPASSDNGITSVNFYVGDSTTPVAGAVVSGAYQASLPMPTVTADTAVTLKVVATSIRGNVTTVTNTVTVIAGGTSFTTNSNITASDTRFENQTIIVRGATLTIDGAHTFARLIVLDGGNVTHTVIAGGSTGLKLTVTGQTYVSCGGALDANGKGYGNNASYPGTPVPYQWIAGSHIGSSNVAGNVGQGTASTFGSVYRPQEAGGGAYNGTAGGGVIRLDSPIIGVDGAIRANGVDSSDRTGAGGSIWITTTTLKAAGGSIEARGGDANYEAGGGGAIAIEYTDGTSALGTPLIRGGNSGNYARGGSGSLYIKGPSSTYGDLTVDIGAGKAADLTVLQPLGSGTAQAGSAGATLVTGRSTTIPPYFAGQWVEISNGTTLKGTWRVGTISDRTVTLVPNGNETIDIQPNDKWQGVHRFDNVRTTYGGRIVSLDPIRLNSAATLQAPAIANQYLEFHLPLTAATTATVTGNLKVPALTAADITIKSGANVYGTSTNGPNPLAPYTLNLTAANSITVESGALIDLNGAGYQNTTSYPGAITPYAWIGGSHMGVAVVNGIINSAGAPSNFGSLYRPQEAGGGAYQGSAGGGVVRINAPQVTLAGTVRANGIDASGTRSGAGGSIWLTTTRLNGTGGSMQVRAGDCTYECGGGGAIAIEYTDAASTLPSTLTRGGNSSNYAEGGAGTLYIKGPTSTYGALVVDNAGLVGEITSPPSLGKGTTQSGTSGATVVTDRTTNVPDYFAGHWVEIYAPDGTLKGAWRIATISNKTVTLTPNANETINAAAGDTWQGVYRFDSVSAPGGSTLSTIDPIRIGDGTGAVVLNGPLSLSGGVSGSDITINGNVTLGGAINATSSVTINAGTTTVPAVSTPALRVSTGATLANPSGSAATPFNITVSGAVTIDGSIDVSGHGYTWNNTYPGATLPANASGGSHIGVGGLWDPPTASTFGSVYRPQEAGGGGESGSGMPGGGVIRLSAGSLALNGSIKADGTNADGSSRGGAGGSIWITTGAMSGTGTVSAIGSHANYGSGAGGAIAIEYANGTSVPWTLTAKAGTTNQGAGTIRVGGAGTVYTRGPSSTYGDVTIDNGSTIGVGQGTSLPSLGRGLTLAGTTGSTVVTDRSVNIPSYFIGNWVEIYAADGTLKGSWKIASINTKTITLQPNANETINVAVGDTWQGVYRFDTLSSPNGSLILGADPVRIGVNGTVVINGPGGSNTMNLSYPINGTDVTIGGNVLVGAVTATNSLTINSGTTTATAVTAPAMHIATGGTLTNAVSSAATPLNVNVSGTLTIDANGSIDVSGHGYSLNTTYPGATLPGNGTGGSHIGVGGLWDPPTASTFGSVYRPQEAGAGGESGSGMPGGGVIRLTAGSVVLNGSIKSDGTNADGSSRGGAGGSIWITTSTMNGTGTVSATGSHANYGSGGGGAIAIEYTSGTNVPWTLTAKGGTTNQGAGTSRVGGAGTVYTRGPSSTYGDVLVDNGTIGNGQGTSLPSLGRGLTLAGTTGSTVVTDRSVNIPSYFIGNWVEIYAADGTLKGSWKIASINTKTITLQPNANETINVAVGDTWQGVYRFDTLSSPNGSLILGADPVRIGVNGTVVINGPSGANPMNLPYAINGTDVTIGGNVFLGGAITATNSLNINAGTTTTTAVTAPTVHIATGATLTNASGSIATPLNINVSGALAIDTNGSIDVSGHGYTLNTTYPGATLPGNGTGGSHIGTGGLWDPNTASTFGSVYRPQEAGGGGDSGSGLPGGGVVRLTAGSLALNGSIKSDGTNADGSSRGGAGGSIWITTGAMSGTGTVSANGSHANYGSGGGGAIAIEYTSGTSVPWTLAAKAGTTNQGAGTIRVGGAGTIYTRGPSSTYGDVLVDNGSSPAVQLTELQALGIGVAQSGSTGNTLVTDRATNIPAYFGGHWVNVTDSNGAVKGSWRVATINNKTVTLAPNGNETISIQPGDRWRGSYKFDSMTLKNCAFRTADLVELGTAVSVSNATYLFGNVSAPSVDVSKITIQPSITGISVAGSANAVTDVDKPISLTLTDTNTGATFTGMALPDGSFAVGVQGNAGDTITIKAKDSHTYPLESSPVTVGTLPSATPAPAQLNKTDWTTDTQFVPRLLAVEGNWLAVSSRPAGNGTSDKVVILDISDPLRPVYKRTISTGSVIYGIRIQNGYLYTANSRFSSINLNDPNSTLNFPADASGDEYSLVVAGTYAYTGEVNWANDGRINVYDISNPAAPRALGMQNPTSIGNNPFGGMVAYGTDYLVGLSWGTRDLVVIDRRNPNALVKVGELQIPNFAPYKGKFIGSKLYLVNDPYTQMVVVDMANPAAPAVAATLNIPASADGIDIVGNDAFLAANSGGLVTTTTDTSNLAVTGSIATGGNAWDVVVQGGVAYVANENGISVVPVNAAPVIRTERISLTLNGSSVVVTGASKAVTGGSPVVTIVDTATNATVMSLPVNSDGSFNASLPAASGDPITITATSNGKTNGPVSLGLVPFGTAATLIPINSPAGDGNWRARTIKAEGNNLVVASFPWDGAGDSPRLQIYDISNPSAPVLKRTVSTVNRVLDFELQNGTAYIAGDYFGTLDLNNPNSSFVYNGSDPSGRDFSIAVAGGYAFTSEVDWANDGRINIYDVSTPSAPRYIRMTGSFARHYFTDLFAYGTNYLIGISYHGDGVDVVMMDRSNVNNLFKVSELSVPNLAAFRGRLVGSKLYFGGISGGAAIVDVSNPAAMTVLATTASMTNSRGADVTGGTMAVANAGGVSFFDVSANALTPIGTQQVGGTVWDVAYGRGQLYVAADNGIVVLSNVTAPPVIDTRLISVSAGSSSLATVTGTAGAISGQSPFTAEVKDSNSGAAISASIAADGSFSASIPASPGDTLTVKVTDANNRVTGPVTVGTMPYGSNVVAMPIVNPGGDTNWRARTIKVEGNNLVISSFPWDGFGDSPKLLIYDISNPSAPVLKRTVNTVNRVLDFELKNGIVYAAGDYFGTLDLNNPNSSFVYNGTDPSGREFSVAVAGGYAFTSEVDWANDGRINIYDVTNPNAPRWLQMTGPFARHYFTDLFAYGNDYLIGVSYHGDGVDVVMMDRRNVNGLFKVSELSVPNVAGFRGKLVGSKLYFGGIDTGAAIVDVSNPAAMTVLASSSSPALSRGADVAGSVMAVAAGGAGVQFFDVSNNTLNNIGLQPTGGMAWDVAFGAANLYVAADQGLVVIQNVVAPPVIDARQITVNTDGTSALVHGNASAITGLGSLTATVTDAATNASSTVSVHADGSFDATLPSTAGDTITVKATDGNSRTAGPIVVGTVPFGTALNVIPIVNPAGDTNWRSRILKIDGNNLVLASFTGQANGDAFGDSNKLVIYDISNPNAPVLKRVVSTVNRILDVEVQNGWAYISGDYFGTLNLNDPNATLNTTTDSSGREFSVAVSNGYAFTSEVDWANDGRILLYDVADPGTPRFIKMTGSFCRHPFTDLLTYGTNYLVGVSYWSDNVDVVVIDKRDPLAMTKVSELSVPGVVGFRGRIVGSKLYFGGTQGGAAVVDLTNPASLQILSSMSSSTMSRGVDVTGSLLAVATGGEGVSFYDPSTATMSLLGQQPTGGIAWDLQFAAGNLYVANDQGLVVVQNVATPPAVRTELISMSPPSGTSTVTGSARAIGGVGNTTVTLNNTTTGASIGNVAVSATGTFSAAITASAGDRISITATDGAGRTTTRALGQAPFFAVTSELRATRDTDGLVARRVQTDGTNTVLLGARSFTVYPGPSGFAWKYGTGATSLTVFQGGTGAVQEVARSGNFVFSASDRLVTFDMTQATPALNVASGTDPCGRDIGVAVSGNYAYTGEADCSNDGRLNIWNITNPAAPSFISQTGGLAGTGSFTFHVLLPLGTQYILGVSPDTAIRDLTVLSISNPTAPARVATLDVPNFSSDAAIIDGNTVYLAGTVGGYTLGTAGGIAVVDVTNPAAPVLKATIATPGYARGLAMVGTNELAVADATTGVTFIDVTDKAHPVVEGTQAVNGSVHDLKAVGKTLYLASETRFQVVQRP